VNVPGPEQRQERKTSGPGVRLEAGLSDAAGSLTLGLEVQAPGAVGALVADDPVDPVLDRLLGVDRSSLATEQLGLGRAPPARKRSGDVLGVQPVTGGLRPLGAGARARVDNRPQAGAKLGRSLGPRQLGHKPRNLGNLRLADDV